MRIGMFVDMYLPHVSGVTNHIRLYRAELERQGHEVTVFTYGNTDYRDLEPRVIRSPALPYGSTGWNVPVMLSREAEDALDHLDIAHAHHPFASCLAALRCRSRTGAPVVFTNHTRYDLYSDTYAAWIPAPIRYEGIKRYLAWLSERVNLTISPSAQLAGWLLECGVNPDKLISMPNAIDTCAFARPAASSDRSRLGLPDDAFAVCYVGRLAREKNVALLLEAFARAAVRDSRLVLVLVGDGPARGECERIASAAGIVDRVRFLGLTPYETVPGILHECDVFATASVSEMYPLVVVEACAAGLPVLGVESPGVSEIVTHDTSGLLCSADPQEFAEQILRAASEPGLMARLRTGAADVALTHDITPSTARLIESYERLLASAALRSA
jgi:glycosyltransferase involved in cell wall biosynthesis